MNKISTFLQQYIEKYGQMHELSVDDKKILSSDGVQNYIVQKIGRRRYKGSSFPPSMQTKVDTIVAESVRQHRPIHFSIPFGGFKNPHLPSYPNIDWAEIFTIVQLRNYAVEIAKGYEPGVIVQFVSDEVFVSRINNMPQSDLDLYNGNFQLALAFIQQFCPLNVKLQYSKIRDEISQEEIFRRIEPDIPEIKRKWQQLSKAEQEVKLAKTARNYRLDANIKDQEEKERLYFESTIFHEAFLVSEWDKGVNWAFAPDMIPVGFLRQSNTWGLHLKSSPSSSMQYWVGYGAVEKRADRFISTMFSYTQYSERKQFIEFAKNEYFPVEIIGAEIPLLVTN